MATQYTLVTGDVQYLSHYLTETNSLTDVSTYEDFTSADSIVLRIRLSGATINTIEATGVIATDDNSIKYVRSLVTIPAVGKYESEVEVYYSDGQHITWKGNTYIVISQLG